MSSDLLKIIQSQQGTINILTRLLEQSEKMRGITISPHNQGKPPPPEPPAMDTPCRQLGTGKSPRP